MSDCRRGLPRFCLVRRSEERPESAVEIAKPLCKAGVKGDLPPLEERGLLLFCVCVMVAMPVAVSAFEVSASPNLAVKKMEPSKPNVVIAARRNAMLGARVLAERGRRTREGTKNTASHFVRRSVPGFRRV